MNIKPRARRSDGARNVILESSADALNNEDNRASRLKLTSHRGDAGALPKANIYREPEMKVLIVEDEPKVVDYLRTGLTEHGWVVEAAFDGEEGAYLAIEYDFDVIVLDVMLPKLDGYGVLKALRARKQTPVIMLTARDRIDDRVLGLREGADDYLTKPFSFRELVERLHALTRRTRSQESNVLVIGDLSVDLINRRATRDGIRLDLTAKEFQLLSVLARRRGETLSKTVITEQVWDINFESNANVVETAVKRLRAKLDGPFSAKLLHTIRGMGYVLELRETPDDGRL
jgi:two-component system copper resistance phosphate regulon response regulator CusR